MIPLLLASLLAPPLPWPQPKLPTVPIIATPSLDLDEPEHSEEYEDRQEEMETMIDEWSAPITTFNDGLESFIVEVPDASSGDFDPGFSAMTEFGSAYDFAEYSGESMGTLAQYMRAGQGLITNLFTTATGLLVDFMLACAVWLMLTRILVFIGHGLLFLWHIGNDIWNAVFNVVPTGG